MAYVVEVIQKPGFLHIRVTGENSVQAVTGYLHDTLAACAEHGCGVVLIEENLSGPSLDVMEVFQLATGMSESARSIIRQVAYVDINRDHSMGLTHFAEDVATNRGMNIRVFGTVKEAERWLKESTQE